MPSMPTINILQEIGSPNAILHRFGLHLFEVINREISKGEKVAVSFEGLHNVTSGFMNASFGNLYKRYGRKLDSLMTLEIHDTDWKEKFDDAKTLALEPEKAKILDEAIADLFD